MGEIDKPPIKLNIGSGDEKLEGYTSVDLYQPADIKAPAWELPFEKESVSEIRAVHLLEHLARNEIMPTLKEWKRVLSKAGNLFIEVPDLSWIMQMWVANGGSYWLQMERTLYGYQEHEGNFHKSGWTMDRIRSTLREAGFGIVQLMVGFTEAHPFEQSILCHAQDTKIVERYGGRRSIESR